MAINKNIKCIVFSLVALTASSCWGAATDPNEDLKLAIRNGDVDGLAQALGNGADPNKRYPYVNSTPLIETLNNSTGEDTKQMVQMLINYGAEVNVTDPLGQTALHYAMAPFNEEALKILLDNGAFVDAQNQYGLTPLMMAVVDDNVPAVQALLEGGADIRLTNNDGRTALDMALQFNNGDIIPILLQWVNVGG